jgi:hypothetical protein
MKKCSRCKELKKCDNFSKNKSKKDGLNNECKICSSERDKIYRKNNKEKEKIRRRKKYLKNREREILRDYEYKKKRILLDPSFKMIRALRDRHSKAVKNAGKTKKFHTKNLLGCDSKTLKDYFESLFRNEMCWENHGIIWHIDHIYPLSKIDWNNSDEIIKYCHYTNLQPLLINENLTKSNKVL